MLTRANITASGIMVKNKVKECSFTPTRTFTVDTGSMAKNMDREPTSSMPLA